MTTEELREIREWIAEGRIGPGLATEHGLRAYREASRYGFRDPLFVEHLRAAVDILTWAEGERKAGHGEARMDDLFPKQLPIPDGLTP